MSIKKYIREHTPQIACLLLGLALFFIGLWQLDLICAPKLDWSRTSPPREILPRWYMHEADAYVMFFGWVMFGTFLMLVALWFWEE